MKRVAAIVLNYNSFEDSEKCVMLLKRQKGVDLKVIIVDNCSTDQSEQKLTALGKTQDVTVIANKENRGYSAGNNIGLKLAAEQGFDYSLIINPDVELRDETYVQQALEKLEEDSRIVVLGTDVKNMKGQCQNPMREMGYWEEIFWPLSTIKGKLRGKPSYICDNAKEGYCEMVSGCCFFVRMDFIQKTGYLDEKSFMYFEESILAARVAKEGYREYFLPELTAYHMHRESEKGNPKKKWDNYYKSRKYFFEKYSSHGKLKRSMICASIWLQKKVMAAREVRKYKSI